MTRAAHLEAIQADLGELGDDEVRTIAFLARRLLEGQRAYGRIDLSNDLRDFRRERAEEVADLLVYSAFQALREDLGHG